MGTGERVGEEGLAVWVCGPGLLFELYLRAPEQLTLRPPDLVGIPFKATIAQAEPQPCFSGLCKDTYLARGQQLTSCPTRKYSSPSTVLGAN